MKSVHVVFDDKMIKGLLDEGYNEVLHFENETYGKMDEMMKMNMFPVTVLIMLTDQLMFTTQLIIYQVRDKGYQLKDKG